MQKAILLMNRVRRDLEKGDYVNALRRRKSTLEAIEKSGQMAESTVEVSEDTTVPMPKYIRDNINDASNSSLPPAYRPILEEFYRRLSEQK